MELREGAGLPAGARIAAPSVERRVNHAEHSALSSEFSSERSDRALAMVWANPRI